MKELNRTNHTVPKKKVRILQFGEGNFLRAFVDWIIQQMNNKGLTDAGVVIVQPTPTGRINEIASQDGLYTLCLEGIDDGKSVQKREIIDVVSDVCDPYTQYAKFLELAENEDLETIISNTTEAGIALDKTDTDFSVCPKSFPGKMLAFLKARYDHFNGDKTRVLQ